MLDGEFVSTGIARGNGGATAAGRGKLLLNEKSPYDSFFVEYADELKGYPSLADHESDDDDGATIFARFSPVGAKS